MYKKLTIIIGCLLIGAVFFVYTSSTYIKLFSESLSGGVVGQVGYYEVRYPTHESVYFFSPAEVSIRAFKRYKSQAQFLTDIDRESFTVLNTSYAKDKHNVYYQGMRMSVGSPKTSNKEIALYESTTKLKNTRYKSAPYDFEVDVGNFEAVNQSYARDGRHVFYKNIILKGADPNDIVFLDEDSTLRTNRFEIAPRFVRTAGKLFYGGKEIVNAVRSGSFLVSSKMVGMLCDKVSVLEFYDGEYTVCKITEDGNDEILSIDIDTLSIVKHGGSKHSYLKDKNYLYFVDRTHCDGVSCMSGNEHFQQIYIVEGASPENIKKSDGAGDVYTPSDTPGYGLVYDVGCLLYPVMYNYKSIVTRTLSQKREASGKCKYKVVGK